MRIPGRHPRATERDLARLADGTLDPGRRERVERSVAASDELQSRLRDQRRAMAAVRAHAVERAPLALRSAVARSLRPAGAVAHPDSRLGLRGAVGAVALTLAAARRRSGRADRRRRGHARRPARDRAVAEPPDDHATLPRLRAAGLPFPYWEDHFGWIATGVRSDDLDGRLLTTVFYRQRRPADRLHDRARHAAAGRPAPRRSCAAASSSMPSRTTAG